MLNEGPENGLDVMVDIIGQQPFINVYTQICLMFPMTNPFSQTKIIDVLTSGLNCLSMSFPWMSGQVVNEGSGSSNSGLYKIKSFQKNPILVIKGLSKDTSVISMDAMRQANFPGLPYESTLAPRMTFPGSSDTIVPDHLPVFSLQVSFIDGGLILTFARQHQAMDFIGQAHMISLLSKACHGDPFASKDLSVGNATHLDMVSLLNDGTHVQAFLARQLLPASSDPTKYPGPPPSLSCSWTIFTFSRDLLATLKDVATGTVIDPPGYISTDDALTALIWRSITRARCARLEKGTEVSLGRAVDVRLCFDLPSNYPGIMQNCDYQSYTLELLLSQPPGVVASHLRLAIDPRASGLVYNTRALAWYLERSADKRGVSFSATLDLTKDVMLSSWVKADVYDLDFGLGLGKPETVRRPKFPPYEGLVYLLPKKTDGEIAVWMCLRDEDLENLRNDEDFTTFGKYVG